MIPEYRQYHGAVLAELIDRSGKGLLIEALQFEGWPVAYLLDQRLVVQIKYATQQLRPWQFTFPASHVTALEKLLERFGQAYVVLVCRSDGMLAISAEQALPSLRTALGDQSWLRADRPKRGRYRLYGPAGEFGAKFGSGIDSVIEALRR